MPLYSAAIFHEMLKLNLRLFLGAIHFQQFVEERLSTMYQCTLSTTVEKLRLDKTGPYKNKNKKILHFEISASARLRGGGGGGFNARRTDKDMIGSTTDGTHGAPSMHTRLIIYLCVCACLASKNTSSATQNA